MALFQANDLCTFFMKYVFMVPPPHFLCQVRMWVVGMITFNLAKEYYDFMKLRTKFRKVNILLFCAVIFLEIAVIIKHGQGTHKNTQASSGMPTLTRLEYGLREVCLRCSWCCL